VPFLLQVDGFKAMYDMVHWLRVEQSQGQNPKFKPFVLGLTTEQARSLPPRVLAERHGILLIRLRSESEEGTIFRLAQRIDLFHQHALPMARRDAKGKLKEAADQVAMATFDYKDSIQRTTGMGCADYLEARGAVQRVRGSQAHPLHKVREGLPRVSTIRSLTKSEIQSGTG
jgi:hypothetical protein